MAFDSTALKAAWGQGDRDIADDVDGEGKLVKQTGEDPYLDKPKRDDDASPAGPVSTDKPEPKADQPTSPAQSQESKVELTEQELEQVTAKLREQFTEEEIEAIPEKVLDKLVQEKANLIKGSRSLNARNQEAAKQRKSLEEALADGNAKIEEKREALEAEYEHKMQVLMEKEEDIKSREKELLEEREEAEEILRTSVTDIEGYEDEYDEEVRADMRTELKVRQAQAKQRLTQIDSEIKEEKMTQKAIAEQKHRVIEDAELVETYIQVQELQQVFPELQTSSPVFQILQEWSNAKKAGTEYVGDEWELAKAMRIYEVMDKFDNQELTEDVSEFYRVFRHNLPELKAAQGEQGGSIKRLKESNLKRQILQTMRNSGRPVSPGANRGGSFTESNSVGINTEEYKKKTGWATNL